MPSATTSGADTGNGGAKSRDHNQGNQDRSYTVEQKAAVLRVRRCQPTAFYDILGLETVKTSCTETEIKKAYRKLSLLTHPDKNGHEQADEAFKMVSRAFGILGDKDKKWKYDQTGGDPDSRFGGGAPQQSPFSGFSRASASRGAGGGGGGGGFEQDISPEEMFNRFFGGGGLGGFGGGGGMFDAGPQFVFNMGGGPGVRVHQFGGARPRRRPRDPNAPPEPPANFLTTLMGLLPLIALFILPLLSGLFSGSDTAAGPQMRFDSPAKPYTKHRLTKRLQVNYYVDPADVEHYTPNKWAELDKTAETTLIQQLNIGCQQEADIRNRKMQDAQGWFFVDQEKATAAKEFKMKNCERLNAMGFQRSAY